MAAVVALIALATLATTLALAEDDLGRDEDRLDNRQHGDGRRRHRKLANQRPTRRRRRFRLVEHNESGVSQLGQRQVDDALVRRQTRSALNRGGHVSLRIRAIAKLVDHGRALIQGMCFGGRQLDRENLVRLTLDVHTRDTSRRHRSIPLAPPSLVLRLRIVNVS
jgi:hypothetical protein